MTQSRLAQGKTRRRFLKEVALAGGAVVAANGLRGFSAPAAVAQFGQVGTTPVVSTSPWAKQVGLELFTVRDVMTDPKSYEAALEKVAAIGYKEVEPAGGYAGMEPKEYRALLDRLGLSMPSTHSGATEGPDLEKQLEGFQIMGIKYTGISAASGRGGAGRGAGVPGGAGSGGPGRGPGGFQSAPQTSDAVKRTADQLNQHGEIAKKFGMKILVHNHTTEFAPLADNPQMHPYDIILANTDPALVVMQMDIGWAVQAGQDPIAMFKKNPGRYELWHVKDMSDIKLMPPNADEGTRMQMGVRAIAPVGLGDIDYKPIFAAADIAGMKHFCIEQDDASDWGDSVASAGVCYENLIRILG
jgi:sugar phosphate isomerase/epimerase